MPTRSLARSFSGEDPAARAALCFLEDMMGGLGIENVGVRLWDATRWPEGARRPVELVLKHPGALRAMFSAGTELALAEAYLYDDFDVEGDFGAVFELPDALERAGWGWDKKLRAARALYSLPACRRRPCATGRLARLSGRRHSPERDRQAIAHHYDVSNDFFSIWLDSRMVYSCAYFYSEDEDLDTAQVRKLDYICRKLRLKAGARFLDIGCGWGSLVMHAAENYGVDATGITLSREQAKLANMRITKAGLEGRCRVLLRDYREMGDGDCYDSIASVGMFEHVGEKVLPAYFAQAHRLLRPGGSFLNHGISMRAGGRKKAGPTFSDAYVFPDGELVPISTTLRVAEEAGFEVRDVESLREHYALTLKRWAGRLEENRRRVLGEVDETTYRVWRLLLHGSAHCFSTGAMNLHQSLLVKTTPAGRCPVPLTRLDWYR